MTKGQIEAQISDTVIRFEKEYMGRGPIETKTTIIDDMVVVRLKGVLTPAEEKLAQNPDGAGLIKQVRMQLLESAKAMLQVMVGDVTQKKVLSLHTDISTKTGERIIVFILNGKFEI
ncbi:MAG TPA: DUF2294 domain-containing protein [Spirochaetota bacterium]|nr:DUF2294 domain-containing protein [Spirochaetota bacterium]